MKFVSDELLIYQYILKEGKLKKKMCIATITNWLTKKFQNPIYFFNAGNLINEQEFSVILEIFFLRFSCFTHNMANEYIFSPKANNKNPLKKQDW